MTTMSLVEIPDRYDYRYFLLTTDPLSAPENYGGINESRQQTIDRFPGIG